VDDMEKTVKALKKKRVKFTIEPHKRSWGGHLAAFKDIDGNSYFLLQMAPGFDK
jgi:catechol 2,3-dioxygenase-like lactoylglutathione lyase family enzyme